MARYVFDHASGRIVPAGVVYGRRAADREQRRSSLPTPRVISDACEFQSMADGQIYTSKAAYRADLRARDLDEVGNDSSLYRDPTGDFRSVETNVAQEAALFAQHVGE